MIPIPKIKGKKGFLLRDLGIMLVILSLVGGACGLFFGDFNNAYGGNVNTSVNSSYADVYNQMGAMNATTAGIQNQINNNQTKIGITGDISNILTGGWGAIKLAFGGLGMTKSIATGMSQDLHLPVTSTFNIPLAITIIIVLIIMFGVINAVFRFFNPL